MFRLEKKVVESVTRPRVLCVVLIVGVFLLSAYIRFALRAIVSEDMRIFLVPWGEALLEGGVPALLEMPTFDYNAAFLSLFSLFVNLPFNLVTNIKLLSLLFDFGGAVMMALCAYRVAEKNKDIVAALAFCFGCLCPLAFLNSAGWGQCDAIYTFFLLGCVYMLLKERYMAGFILFSVALCFKLQAIFFLPVLIILYFSRRKFGALQFLWIPFFLLLSGLPMMAWGRGPFFAFEAYFQQTGAYKVMTANYPNFYTELNGAPYAFLSKVATLFTLCFVLALLVVILYKKWVVTDKGIVLLGAFVTLFCVFFLPSMHERYAYAGEIMLLVILAWNVRNRKVLVAACVACITSTSQYLTYLFQQPIGMFTLPVSAVCNFIVLILLAMELFQKEEGIDYNPYFKRVIENEID